MNRFARFFLPLVALFLAVPAFADDGMTKGLWGIGAGIAMGLAVLGGALAQGRAAASALDGIARNPSSSGKIFVPFILGMALIESLVLLAFLISMGVVGPAKLIGG